MGVKEKDLPVAGSIASGDYVRIVTSGGASKKAQKSALYDVMDDYVIETGTSNGWNYRKWNSGRMEAEKDVTTGSSWSSVGSAGINYNQTTLTPPTGMTVTGGYANPKTISQYLIGAQIQLGANTALEVHRLSSSSATFNYHVTLIGTYS